MKITHLYIKNYKSIKEIDISLSDKVNVFIGENSVGKSNIFSAIDWVLGPTYPTFNNVSSEDFYGGDTEAQLVIRIHFDDGHFLELNNGRYLGRNKKGGLNIDGTNYVTDEIRQKYVSAFVGADRKIADNPASNRWTLLGRLLRDVNARFVEETIIDEDTGEVLLKADYFKRQMQEIRDRTLFSVTDDNGQNIMEEFTRILGEETARQLNRTRSDFAIDLNMYDAWNYYRTMQILVNESETGMKFRASELGMGVQASITIAILKAYSKLKLKNQTPIIIDEPELYLHPQGRRNFYQIIRELADNGTQVLLTTHSSEFIDLNHFHEIFVVRKSREKGTYIRRADPQKFADDFYCRYGKETTALEMLERYKNAFENTGDSQKSSEALFARKVILVEGESEVLILPYLFMLLGFNPIAEGITIVRCGGKSEIDRFYRLYSEFGIPCFIIFDGDHQNVGGKDEEATIRKNKGILELFGEMADFPDDIVHDQFLGFKFRLEENLNIGDASGDKALGLFRRVREKIKDADDVPHWVAEVIEKTSNLPNESSSVLKIRSKPSSPPTAIPPLMT